MKKKKGGSAWQLVIQHFQNMRSRMAASRFLLIQVYFNISIKLKLHIRNMEDRFNHWSYTPARHIWQRLHIAWEKGALAPFWDEACFVLYHTNTPKPIHENWRISMEVRQGKLINSISDALQQATDLPVHYIFILGSFKKNKNKLSLTCSYLTCKAPCQKFTEINDLF